MGMNQGLPSVGQLIRGCIINQQWVVNSQQSLDNLKKFLDESFAEKKYIKVKWTFGKQRTNKQNSSIHKYCELLADSLNDAGLDMRKVLKESVDIPWTPATVKEQLWRPIQVPSVGKLSTKDLDRAEVSKVYDILNRHLNDKLGVHVPFPKKEQNQ